jgi:hypothetical protein
MRLQAFFTLAAACLMLSGCGKDFNKGFGEMEGWGGYTKGFGDVDEGMDKPVGLCSYTGGCMPDKAEEGTDPNSFKGTKSARSSDAGSPDGGGGGGSAGE